VSARSGTSSPSVAIVHEYLNQRGGGERVVLELTEIWPDATIYTLAYDPTSTYPEFATKDVRTSFLGRLSSTGLRAAVPLYPAAFRGFGRFDCDLVVSSASGWSHVVATEPATAHVVYCHTLWRPLYAPEAYLGRTVTGGLGLPVLRALRRLDRWSASRADLWLANADNVRRRVDAAYGIEAHVVHPPVDTERFVPRSRGERLLVVSRLLPYKRVDLIVAAATRAGLPLDVVGDGPVLEDLRAIAGPSVAFHGRTDDGTVTELMESCRTVCLPGVEDFGIVPIEANAAGKPVVAFAAGGALETLQDGVTAALFDRPSVDAVLDAIARADALTTSPERIARSAERFSRAAFRERFRAVVEPLLRGDG
jgi:glycosyltransferase involved in cell wall biosynthesis